MEKLQPWLIMRKSQTMYLILQRTLNDNALKSHNNSQMYWTFSHNNGDILS